MRLKINKKAGQLIDLESSYRLFPSDDAMVIVLAESLYISAKGTRHFYEALRILATIRPEFYNDEFIKEQGDF